MPILSNPKWELYAQELAKGSTADAAYRAAGYAPNPGNATRLKLNEAIVKRIEEILSQAAEKAGVTVERIVNELAKIGFADIRKAVKWGESVALPGEDGSEVYVAHDVGLLSSTDIDDDTAAAISEVRKTKDGIAIKFHDKRAALAELGKHLGLKTKLELSGEFTLEQLVNASFEPPGEQAPAAFPPKTDP